jgi:Mycothiol maleylpyruvate isomerase N-terminal domain
VSIGGDYVAAVTQQAVDALVEEQALALTLVEDLTEDEWAAASGCEGWSVQDLVCHLACGMQLVVDPGSLPSPADGVGAEAAMDQAVIERRSWSPDEVLGAYRQWSEQGRTALAALQDPGLADTPLSLGDLGTHPLHLVANAYAFDTYCHLRFDLLAPRGPLEQPALPEDELRLRPTVDWLLAGLPQMCTPALKPVMTVPWVLELTGPGGGTWTVTPTDIAEHACVVTEGDDGSGAFRVTSSTHDFVAWSTQRTDWRELATVAGDEAAAATILDAVNLI